MRATFPIALITAALLPGLSCADLAKATARARSGLFEATAEVPCAQEAGQALATCTATVSRADGSAVVTVTFANGFSRTLMFTDREFLRGNATMSGVGTDTDWRLSDGTYLVRVDDQRFELPEALVFEN